MKPPLISIVICCYNRAHLLPLTMASVFAQSYKPIEIVVIDDGSTDNTAKLMSNYGDKVRYFRQDNQGIAVARTTGCHQANGEYIAFQDDDDLMAPNRIEHLYEALLQHPSAIFSCGNLSVIDQDGNETGEIKKSEIHKNTKSPVYIKDGYNAVLTVEVDPVPHTALFRKIDGERVGWFDKRFKVCEDTDFFWRLAELGSIVYLPEVVSYYRKGHDSLASKRMLKLYNRFLLFEKHLHSITEEKKQFKKILQFRLRNTLENIDFFAEGNSFKPELDVHDLIKRGESLLNLKNYLLNKWAIHFKNPMRRMYRKLRFLNFK